MSFANGTRVDEPDDKDDPKRDGQWYAANAQ